MLSNAPDTDIYLNYFKSFLQRLGKKFISERTGKLKFYSHGSTVYADFVEFSYEEFLALTNYLMDNFCICAEELIPFMGMIALDEHLSNMKYNYYGLTFVRGNGGRTIFRCVEPLYPTVIIYEGYTFVLDKDTCTKYNMCLTNLNFVISNNCIGSISLIPSNHPKYYPNTNTLCQPFCPLSNINNVKHDVIKGFTNIISSLMVCYIEKECVYNTGPSFRQYVEDVVKPSIQK